MTPQVRQSGARRSPSRGDSNRFAWKAAAPPTVRCRMPMGRRTILAALTGAAALTTLALPSIAEGQSLRGSRSTVARVYERAAERGLYFYKTSGGVKSA